MYKKVRILVAATLAGAAYRPDDVVILPDDLARQAEKDGVADGAKAAVEYALSLTGAKIIKHASPEPAAVPSAIAPEVVAPVA